MSNLPTILYVEDSDGDVTLVKSSLAHANIKNEVIRASSAKEGLDIMTNRLEKPFFVLSDINMPGIILLGFLQGLFVGWLIWG